MTPVKLPAGITFDTREFDRALKEYIIATSMELSDALNKKALFIARGAIKQTKVANRYAIEQLGLYGYFRILKNKKGEIRKDKAGKIRFAKKKEFQQEVETSIANYLGAQLRRKTGIKGKSFENRAELIAAARKFIAGKLRAVGFLRSGWIASIRKLTPLVGEAYQRPADVVARWQSLGRCTPAKPSLDPFVEMENNATLGVRWNDSKAAALGQKLATEGFRKAFDAETQSMQKYIADKLQKTANKFIPPKTSTK